MLEKISQFIDRKFAEGSKPTPKTVVGWIKSGKYYGEQIGSLWFIDESITPIRTVEPVDTGNPRADKILRKYKHGR